MRFICAILGAIKEAGAGVDKMRVKKLISIFVFVLCMLCVAACTKKNIEYEIRINGNLGESLGFFNEDATYYNQEYLNIKDCVKESNDYKVQLENYFYDSVTGNVAYIITISKQKADITDAEYEKILHEYRNGDISVSFERTSNMIVSDLKKSGSEVYLYESQQVSMLESGKDSNLFSENKLENMNFKWKENYIDFMLPTYQLNQEVVEFNASSSDRVSYCACSEHGICIVWNLTNIIEAFNHEMELEKKKNGNRFDVENYDYIVYKEIEIVYRDGKRNKVGNDIQIADGINDNREDDMLGNTRIRFNEKINLKNVKMIVIDGLDMLPV